MWKLLFAAGLFSIASALAQPAFEVASIKPGDPDSPGASFHIRNSLLDIRNYHLKTLIELAWHVHDYQVSGGPNWVDSAGFDIMAKAGRPAQPAELFTMLQTLLAERFHLTFHREPKLFSGYRLVVGKTGFKLTPSAGSGPGGTSRGPALLKALHQPMAGLVVQLTDVLGAPVQDATGISGSFDFKLEWTPDASHSPDNPGAEPSQGGPSLFTAIQEQLGLKLEAHKVPADLLVIDHAEKPSEN